jgi:hypothetical protein
LSAEPCTAGPDGGVPAEGRARAAYLPPACLGVFADVACPSLFADWIEQLYAEGVTGGCGAGPLIYCPSNPVTRGQMSAFLTKTFHLN